MFCILQHKFQAHFKKLQKYSSTTHYLYHLKGKALVFLQFISHLMTHFMQNYKSVFIQ